jgi:hypothetical protein
VQQAGKIEEALKSGFLKTDANLLLEEGMAECLKIRKEVARRCVRVCLSFCVSLSVYVSLSVCPSVPKARGVKVK